MVVIVASFVYSSSVATERDVAALGSVSSCPGALTLDAPACPAQERCFHLTFTVLAAAPVDAHALRAGLRAAPPRTRTHMHMHTRARPRGRTRVYHCPPRALTTHLPHMGPPPHTHNTCMYVARCTCMCMCVRMYAGDGCTSPLETARARAEGARGRGYRERDAEREMNKAEEVQ